MQALAKVEFHQPLYMVSSNADELIEDETKLPQLSYNDRRGMELSLESPKNK